MPYDAQFSLLWEITKESEYQHTQTTFMKRGLYLVIVRLYLVKAGLYLTSPLFKVVAEQESDASAQIGCIVIWLGATWSASSDISTILETVPLRRLLLTIFI